MVIIRSLTSLAPAVAVVDADAYLGSKASAVLLTQPVHGWNLAVEVDCQCFYDATSLLKAV